MAEALARKYGSDVIDVSSAGIFPAAAAHRLTRAVLTEKNVELGEHVPRNLRDIKVADYDLIVNMSGADLGFADVPVLNWDVDDPVNGAEPEFRRAREEIEMRVMQLILRVRAGKI
jgi:protein-tyrosine-phosphatase